MIEVIICKFLEAEDFRLHSLKFNKPQCYLLYNKYTAGLNKTAPEQLEKLLCNSSAVATQIFWTVLV